MVIISIVYFRRVISQFAKTGIGVQRSFASLLAKMLMYAKVPFGFLFAEFGAV